MKKIGYAILLAGGISLSCQPLLAEGDPAPQQGHCGIGGTTIKGDTSIDGSASIGEAKVTSAEVEESTVCSM